MVESEVDSSLNEVAKASQEKWKAIQKGLELTDRAGNFLGAIFGPSAENVGGILGDQTRHWRAKNLDRLAKYWQAILETRGINECALEHLPFGDAFKVIEAASMEEDEDVQKLWAELLSNAVDSSNDTEIKKVYIDLLKSISSSEVALLNLLWLAEGTVNFKTREELESFNQKLNAFAESSWRKLSKDTRDTAIQNLVRLRCLSFRPQPPSIHQLFEVPRQADQPWPGDCALVNVKEFEKLMLYYEELILVASGVRDHKGSSKIPLQGGFAGISSFSRAYIDLPEMSYILTPMAKDLLRACKGKSSKNDT